MNDQSLREKIKKIVSTYYDKTCRLLRNVNNALIHFSKKRLSVLGAWILLAMEKVGGTVLFLMTQFKRWYKNAYTFLIEKNNKQEILKHYYNLYFEKAKKFILISLYFFLEAGKKCYGAISRQIEKQEKLSRFIKKWGNEIKTNYAALKKTVMANLLEVRDVFSQYEWYQQIMEASRPEDRRITLMTCLFTNLLALAFPMSLMQMYDRIIPNQSYATLTILSIGVVIAILLEMTLRILRSYVNLWADARYEYAMSKKAFQNLIRMPLYLYENTDMGTRIKQFAVLDQLRGFYNNQLMTSIFDLPFLLIYLFAIYYIAEWLVIIPILLGIVLTISSFRHIDKARDMLEKKLNLEAKENDFLVNVLGHIHTAKSLAIENLLIRRYERMQNTSVDINYESTVHMGDMDSVKSIVSQSGTVLVGAAGAIAAIHGDIAVGSLIATILLTGRFMAPLVRSVAILGRWKMVNIVRHQLDVVLNFNAQTQLDVSDIRGDIELNNLGYLSKSDGMTQWALKEINVQIPSHSMTAITGDPKDNIETLLSILACITRPTVGEYLIDQCNVDQLKNYSIRNKIAYLAKNGTLFQGTIMDNISAFNPDFILEAERYANMLGLNEIILKLPLGYDTLVGDKAVHALPGSVVNLIYIIRTLVNKPKIILCDPADMDLEEGTIIKLVVLLKMFKQFSTVIVLSSDKATSNLADVVFEMKNGELKRV